MCLSKKNNKQFSNRFQIFISIGIQFSKTSTTLLDRFIYFSYSEFVIFPCDFGTVFPLFIITYHFF